MIVAVFVACLEQGSIRLQKFKELSDTTLYATKAAVLMIIIIIIITAEGLARSFRPFPIKS